MVDNSNRILGDYTPDWACREKREDDKRRQAWNEEKRPRLREREPARNKEKGKKKKLSKIWSWARTAKTMCSVPEAGRHKFVKIVLTNLIESSSNNVTRGPTSLADGALGWVAKFEALAAHVHAPVCCIGCICKLIKGIAALPVAQNLWRLESNGWGVMTNPWMHQNLPRSQPLQQTNQQPKQVSEDR